MPTFIHSPGQVRVLTYHVDTGSTGFLTLGSDGYIKFLPAITSAFKPFEATGLFRFERVGFEKDADIRIKFERIDGVVPDVNEDDRLMGTVLVPMPNSKYTKYATIRVDSDQAWRFARTGRFAALLDGLSLLDARPYFRASLVHEIGHALGLDHVSLRDRKRASIMHADQGGSRFESSTLYLWDIGNLKTLYPKAA